MNDLEPVKVATVIVSSLFGPTVAHVVGPYSVIILAASLGAAWSLGSKDTLSAASAFWFFIRINLTAILITVFIATYVGKKIGIEDATWLLAPIALVIGGIGDKWGTLFIWLVDSVKNFINKKTGS